MHKKYFALFTIVTTLLPAPAINSKIISSHKIRVEMANSDPEEAAKAIQRGASIRFNEATDVTLHWAIAHNYVEIAKKLIAQRPELININHLDGTPPHTGSNHGKLRARRAPYSTLRRLTR